MPRVFSYDDFFQPDAPPGTFWWTTMRDNDGQARRVLLLKTPCRIFPRRLTDHSVLYVKHAPGNWARPGEIDGWDGNEDSPTLSPSILVQHIIDGQDVECWHGFLTAGEISP